METTMGRYELAEEHFEIDSQRLKIAIHASVQKEGGI
jgi:hypothetical protein